MQIICTSLQTVPHQSDVYRPTDTYLFTYRRFCQFPLNAATQMYVLDWITDNVYNSSTSVEESNDPNYAPSPCDPNITDDQLQLSNR